MAKKPKIRFNGFQKDWEEQKLGECFKERQDRSAEGELISVTINSGVVRAADTGRRDSSSADKSHYKVVKKGDFAYNSMRMWQGACGDSKYDGILSPAYTVAIPLGKIDTSFFTYLSKTANQLRTYRINSQGMTSDTWNLKFPTFAKIGVTVPDVDEQKQISQFLASIDETISLRERELEKLKQLKAACLDKMFANGGGKSRPSIRFAGFTDEWREEIARLIFQTVCEKNHPELPVLSATQDKGMVIRDDKVKKVVHDVSNEVTYKRVCPGQFVIHLRSFQGGFAHSNVEGITSPAYTIMDFIDKSKHDDYFWKYIFMSKRFIKRLETVTYGIRDGRSISYEDFTGLGFAFPEQVEQAKIAKVISLMDKTTSLRQAELTKLRNLKQACLGQMFAA